MAINVKDPQFGAKGDGTVDDSAAIQSAITYAKSLPTRATIYFPPGYYFIGSSINLTNSNGIWLVGDGGSYLNTVIVGNTGSRPMFDFSGSSYSGCENFTFLYSSGSSVLTPSVIGVQFALTNNGGLNCGIKKCYFQLDDNASANGGLGTIGLINIRSEEFFIHECLIRANTPIILSYAANIAVTGVNFTASSAYQTLASGTGSMGVVSINGTSLQCLQNRQPAMILAGTNSINFQGYLARVTAGIGTNETAVLCTISTTNLKIHATIESFSRMVQIGENSGFENCELDIIASNATAPTTELINVTNSIVVGLRARIAQPIPSERNRFVIYHSPSAGGTQQASGYVMNSEITCFTTPNNQFIISQNLLRRSTNVIFNTPTPFEKRNGRIKLLTNNTIFAGVVGSLSSINIFRFKEALQPASAISSGFYRILFNGIIRAGGYGSGKAATLSFEAQIVTNQYYSGSSDPISTTVVVLDQNVGDPSYLNINGILLGLTFNSGVGSVTLTPRVTGSGIGEPVYYEGFVELQSDFFINDPIPLE
ncbi:glycosyl hydrolase family 28-related protein [Spirosoma validum]|uniref:Rhamnogalacturonase A/B/Epimerase-like pectate lyase domain-containing protein n=1 Tax=Spirosoma validum TaxID=2771355 RepID=A0A927AY79_9BACT|nr:glycosyl hydrolase family 28-related protein [Spirosoma validum]MBD2751862.1 hypothetical protein [Spirosoma validum]